MMMHPETQTLAASPVRSRAVRLAGVFAGLSALMLSGCNVLPEPQPDSVRYFTLSEPVSEVEQGGAQVRPVQLAGHLRNRAMAVRLDANEVIYLDDVRWAESLDEAITQVLRSRLAGRGDGESVTVKIHRCEVVRSKDNAVEFAATYTIRGDDEGSDRRGAFTATSRRWDGSDYGVLVGMIREAARELGDKIASEF